MQIAAGGTHSAAVCEAGAVWTWGDGACGKLGHGNERRYATPLRVERFVAMRVRVREVSAGGRHTLAVTTEGELFGWGSNAVGQLGLAWNAVGLGHGRIPGSDLPIRIDVGPDAQTTVQSASAGEEHSLVLTDKGKVYAMGDNSTGALGLGNRGSKVRPYSSRLP